MIFAQTKQFNLAKTLFHKAIKINPHNPSINNNLGNIFFELGEKEKAIKYYEKVIQLQPNHGDVYYNLGIIFNSLGKYQKAANYFQKTIQINPNNLKNYNIFGAKKVFKVLKTGKNMISKSCLFRRIPCLKPLKKI